MKVTQALFILGVSFIAAAVVSEMVKHPEVFCEAVKVLASKEVKKTENPKIAP